MKTGETYEVFSNCSLEFHSNKECCFPLFQTTVKFTVGDSTIYILIFTFISIKQTANELVGNTWKKKCHLWFCFCYSIRFLFQKIKNKNSACFIELCMTVFKSCSKNHFPYNTVSMKLTSKLTLIAFPLSYMLININSQQSIKVWADDFTCSIAHR